MVKGNKMSSKNKIKLYSKKTDHLYMVWVYGLTLVLSLAVLVPLVFVVAASFSSPEALLSARVFLWPVDFNLHGYQMVFEHRMLINGFQNTILYTVIGTIVNLTMTVLAAYPLSRKDLKIRTPVMLLFTFTMLFSGGMIPTYLLVKDLKLLNTFWAMVIPSALSVWNVIITRTYFQTNLPAEMLESAGLDGCDDLRFVLKIALPLSVPILAVNVLLYAVGHWNSYFRALIYLNDNKLYPLQLVLRDILIQDEVGGTMDAGKQLEREQMRYLLQYSTIVVATVPVAILYPFVQKYFVSGLMTGAVKG